MMVGDLRIRFSRKSVLGIYPVRSVRMVFVFGLISFFVVGRTGRIGGRRDFPRTSFRTDLKFADSDKDQRSYLTGVGART